MKEILPGVRHWTTMHPKINYPVSSHYLADEKTLIDPFLPEGGLGALGGPVEHVLLTNRHHYRGVTEVLKACDCKVWCVEQGMHEFEHGEPVRPFHFGDTLVGGIEAIEVGVLCPDETALLIPREGGILACADGVVRAGDGPLAFVPEEYMGDDPAAVKAGLKKAYAKLLDRDFDHLLLAHGNPFVRGAKQALREFCEV